MVRTPEGTFPLTDFIGKEQTYSDDAFVAAQVKKGNSLLYVCNRESKLTFLHSHSGPQTPDLDQCDME